jgi:hypothetical protein
MKKVIEKLVGRKGGDYYVCDYVFKEKGLQGATASVFRPVSEEEYEEAYDLDNLIDRFQELWAEAVKDGRTEDSLEEFCQIIADCDGDEALWDLSYYQYWDLIREAVPELTEKEYPILECVGGGRSFHRDMVWDVLYDAEVWALIRKYETGIEREK